MSKDSGDKLSSTNVALAARAQGVMTAAEATPMEYFRALLGVGGAARFESETDYAASLAAITDALSPRDFIESTMVKDMADHAWEVQRCKRVIVTLLNGSLREAIVKILKMSRLEDPNNFSVFQDVFDFEANAIIESGIAKHKRFQDDLKRLSLDVSAITDAAYLAKLDDIERLQRLMASIEVRRLSTLRELERYRDSSLRKARAASGPAVIDAEFQ